MNHIFVVDDERNIRDLIKKYLEREGYKVTTFPSGSNLVSDIKKIEPDLIVLDIMMPDINGLEICKEIRRNSDIPIVFVSAKDEELDRILGLELGADDYLSKPFSPRELVIRIKTILRRIQKKGKQERDVTTIKDINIHHKRRQVLKGDIELGLTIKEYELLEFLARNKNIPYTREQLIEKIWDYGYAGDGRVIDDLVKRLRKKFKTVESNVEIITVWGFGYRIDDK